MNTMKWLGLIAAGLFAVLFIAQAKAMVTDDEQMSTVKIETPKGMGSGVIIGDNMVLTALHVVDGTPTVRITFHDGTVEMGQVVGVHAPFDYEFVKVKTPVAAHVVVQSCAKLKLGEPIDVLGYPLDLGLVYSPGIVSSIDTATNPQTNFQIAISALITHGNSGGPVFNMNGELIGIVDSMVAAPDGPSISLIMPIYMINPTCAK